MPRTTKELRKNYGLRLSDTERELFDRLAHMEGVKTAEYIRHAAMQYATMTIEDKGVFEELGMTKEEGAKTIRQLISEAAESMVSTVKSSDDQITKRCDRLERLMRVFIYTFLYHTPEVPEDLKGEAQRSAMERRKKIYDLAADEGVNS